MRLTVLGAGAIGVHLTARLARAGLRPRLLARAAQAAVIRDEGLRFEGAEGHFQVPVDVSADPADFGPQDAVIVAVKAHALPATVDTIQPLLGPSTVVVTAVNGVPWWYFHGAPGERQAWRLERLDPQARLWREIGPQRVIGCVVQSANEIVAAGHVRNGSASNGFVIGEPDGSLSPRVRALADWLRQGIPELVTSQDIRREIWAKLLLNMSSSPLACLTHSSAADIAAAPALHPLFRRTLQEGAGVAAALGCAVEVDPEARLARMAGIRHRSSMLQDLEAGRPLEIDAQLRVVQDLARRTGVDTPTLDTLLALLVQRARGAGLYP